MSVNTTITGISQTAASNGPDGSADPPSSLDDAIRYALSFIAMLRDGDGYGVFTTIASASTINLNTSGSINVDVTGTTGISTITLSEGRWKLVRFAAALTLTNSASLVLPGGVNITTATGDFALFVGRASSVTACVGYFPIAGTASVVGSALQAQSYTAFTTGGTSTAYTGTPSPAISGYAAGQSFFVTFNAASGASPTLQISGVASPPNLVYQQADGTFANIGAGQIPINHRSRVTLLSATQAWVEELPPFGATRLQSITATMASNIITTTVLPTSLDFRSSTLTTGAPNTRSLGSVDTVTIPALASLGVPTGQSGRIVRLLIDNGGTLEGAVINLAGGVNLDETGLISTTAISGTATAANVAYSTTARTNVPYRVVGFFDAVWTSGTGWSAPTLVQGQGGQALAAMQSLGYGQTVQTGLTRTSGTTYYNTTGKPIFLVCLLTANASSMSTSISINGGAAVVFAYAFGPSGIGAGSFVIPAGASYVLTDAGSVTSRVNTELR